MLRFLPAPIHGAIGLVAFALNTIFWSVPLYAAALAKLLIPIPAVRRWLSAFLVEIAENWIAVDSWMMRSIQRTPWQVTGLEGLRRDGWYLICCNHNSWVDIPILQRVFYKRIPFVRFFIKQELIWVPLLGLAWWALDFPFMKRYSPEYLAKHPEKRGVDVKTTRKACEKFRNTPTAVLNFLEGTRRTAAKHQSQDSPYDHLLRPKAGGMASAVAAMGDMFDAILDVTIIYPDGPVELWGLLSGQLGRVVVHVEQRPVPPEWIGGDYANDPAFRASFQAWVQQIWAEKDALIGRVLQKV
ncbi:MAG: acyltransferase [Chloroflexales bacterium]|nr:acyltransferase [Chloroflexales bacterium]